MSSWILFPFYSLTFFLGIGGGYPCFIACVVCIGVMTSLIGDIASHLGCTVGLKDSVTALAFVSLGTSLPGIRPFFCFGGGGVEGGF